MDASKSSPSLLFTAVHGIDLLGPRSGELAEDGCCSSRREV